MAIDMDFWDKDGKLITLQEWSRLHKDRKYKFVAETKVAGGEIVSTWFGRDQSCSHYPTEKGKPLIFGTILRLDGGEWGDESFTASLTECLAEHQSRVVGGGSIV